MTAATRNWLYRAACAAFVAATLAISGCSSSPQLHYHTLVPLPQSSTDVEAGNGILIDNVIVPPQVDRSELVVRQDVSGLVVLESEWWGAPLADEIRSALATRFARTGNNAASISVSVNVTRFDSVPGQYAWLEASYQLIDHETEASPRLSCTTRLRKATSEGIDALVNTHQDNIQQLADQIIAAAHSLQTEGEKTRCP
ncbi:PqiC family protein [Marinobacter sp. 1Y8]